MVVAHHVLRLLPFILDRPMRQEVGGVGLLEQHISAVPFKADYPGDHGTRPAALDALLGRTAVLRFLRLLPHIGRRDVLVVQLPCHIHIGLSVIDLVEDVADDLGFFLNDFKAADLVTALQRFDAVLSLHEAVAVEVDVLGVPLWEPLLVAPLDVGGDGAGFFLGNGRKGRQDEVAGRILRIEVLLFKEDGHMVIVEDVQRSHEVAGIAGESGNGFAHDAVDFPLLAMAQEPPIAGAPLLVRAGNAVVGIDTGARPVGILLKQRGEILVLSLVGVLLVVGIRGDTDVSRHPEDALLRHRSGQFRVGDEVIQVQLRRVLRLEQGGEFALLVF